MNQEGSTTNTKDARRKSYRFLTIDRCPTHGFWAVCIGDGAGGTRLTPSKCCGSWNQVYSWHVTPDQLREMANELECQADAIGF